MTLTDAINKINTPYDKYMIVAKYSDVWVQSSENEKKERKDSCSVTCTVY